MSNSVLYRFKHLACILYLLIYCVLLYLPIISLCSFVFLGVLLYLPIISLCSFVFLGVLLYLPIISCVPLYLFIITLISDVLTKSI